MKELREPMEALRQAYEQHRGAIKDGNYIYSITITNEGKHAICEVFCQPEMFMALCNQYVLEVEVTDRVRRPEGRDSSHARAWLSPTIQIRTCADYDYDYSVRT